MLRPRELWQAEKNPECRTLHRQAASLELAQAKEIKIHSSTRAEISKV
jgi:hypothetical protein